ncbi:hypothetical protein [Variovorax boronicumulans]|uniref:hypothetical protein n=1 Tax=Variovorax boronicumulans TaxID=436515 RepID=UPI001C57689D
MFLSTPSAHPSLPGVTVREISPAEYLHEVLGQARLDVPTVRGIHKVPLRGPAPDLELVPMEGARQ